MRIYELTPSDMVKRLDMSAELQSTLLRPLGKGVRFDGVWTPPRVWCLENNQGSKKSKLSDLTSIAAKVSIPILSSTAKGIIAPLIGDQAQWLPLSFEQKEYYLLNSLRISDALDCKNSDISLRTDGKIWDIIKYAFRLPDVQSELLFKVRQKTFSILVTDKFRDVVLQQGLTGFFFQPVWDSEHKPFEPVGRTKDIIDRPEIYGPEGFVPNVREYWPPEWFELEKTLISKKNNLAN